MAKVDKILSIGNMHCASCAQKIEKKLRETHGIENADVNFGTNKAHIRFRSQKINQKQIENIIQKLGYGVIQKGKEQEARVYEQSIFKKRFFISLICLIPLLYVHLALIFEFPLPEKEITTIIQLFFATVILICGGSFFVNGFRSLKPNMDTLVALGSGSAYIYSLYISYGILQNFSAFSVHQLQFTSAGFIITFILLGKWIESFTKGKTANAIHSLMQLSPDQAIVKRQGKEISIPISEVKVGDIVIVKPGAKVPVDGTVLEGESTLDQSLVTGESIPVEKQKGSHVIGGTINQKGAFVFRAEKVGKDTFLAHIITTVEQAQNSKTKIQSVADTVAAFFVPFVLCIALLSFLYWGFFETFELGLQAFIAVLIIACPCALGLATPTAVMMGVGLSAKNGILFRLAESLQKAEKIDTIVFDKTGTLTKAETKVTDMHAVEGYNPKEIIKLAAIAEKRSEHPLADAVLEAAKKARVKVEDPEKFVALPGNGVKAHYLHKKILVGKPRFIQSQGIEISSVKKEIEKLETKGRTALVVAVNKSVIGLLGISDTLKEDAKQTVEALQDKQVIMITGDTNQTAMAIAREAGIEIVLSNVLPVDKAKEIKKLQQEGRKVAMIGDGINDAPALAQADVGIALGSGSDAAIDSGTVVLLHNNLTDVAKTFSLAKYTMKKIRQNLAWAFGYNILALPLAAGVLYPFTGWFLHPAIGALAMSLSSISVILNSLSMKRQFYTSEYH